MDIKGFKQDCLKWVAENQATLSHLGTQSELENYLKDEFRELDLSNSWNDFAEKVKTIDKSKNPNNILLYSIFGAPLPSRLHHHYTGGDFPDIDLDFEPESRDVLKAWLRDTFGQDNCMEVSTSGGTHVKGAIQDLARIAGVDPQEVFAITTKIDYNVNNDEENKLEWILANNVEVGNWLNDHPQIKDWVEKMQEVKRSIGKHASAYIISSEPVSERIPIVKGKNKEFLTGYPESSAVKSLNEIGLIKFDLLGLENLTVIRDTLELIEERHGTQIDWDLVDVNDPKVYELIRRGFNGGIFQIDSPLAAMVISTIQPTNFEDLSALNALIRPSCLEVKSHESYRDHKIGKFNRDEFPVWKELEGKVSDFTYAMLDATYGIPIYQEQTMALLAEFCEVHLDETNKMRKIIGIPANKKKPEHWDYINKQKDKWMKTAAPRVGEKVAWDWWETAVGSLSYGFNRSHSISYAMIAFREMYLKVHYPKEFYCALLKTTVAESANLGRSKLMKFAIEARHLDVPIESPEVNLSKKYLDYNGDTIYIGFEQIKGVGDKAAKDIVKRGPYTSLDDFLEKHKKGSDTKVNKTCINALIFTNAFRNIENRPRAELAEQYWRTLLPKKRQDEEIALPTDFEILKREHELLTIVLSEKNPIDLPYGYMPITKALDTGKDRICKIKGLIEKISWHTSRSGNPYARLIINDLENSAIILVWKNYHNQLRKLTTGDIISVKIKHLDGETFSMVKIEDVQEKE